MVKVLVVVREAGRLKPDYSLEFELPQVPTVGSYISIQRPDKREPYGEDLIVRQIWWRLSHPETGSSPCGTSGVGRQTEIIVECDMALDPYSSDNWRALAEGARRGRGANIEEFAVERFAIREADIDN